MNETLSPFEIEYWGLLGKILALESHIDKLTKQKIELQKENEDLKRVNHIQKRHLNVYVNHPLKTDL